MSASASYSPLQAALVKELEALKTKKLYKEERIITSAQGPSICTQDDTQDDKRVLNFCANNYLGLSAHPAILAAAQETMSSYGFGLSSVRFICGTQSIHKALEARISAFLGTEDTLLYAAAFDANGGLFESLFGPEDLIISDKLNHASLIDGIRLSKAQRHLYEHNAMDSLEEALRQRAQARHTVIVTDGVFSMDGTIAQLDKICALAQQYQALVMVDDCHATGVLGKAGQGSPAHHQVTGRVDVITGTLGKALGGASGGFTSGRKEIIELLRQRSRPYLFSNSLAPPIVGGSLKALDILEDSPQLLEQLHQNARYFRTGIQRIGFDIKAGTHPIVPIMIYDAERAQQLASRLLRRNIYVISFSYPVVPQGQARIRVQLSAAHTKAQLDAALVAFEHEGKASGVI